MSEENENVFIRIFADGIRWMMWVSMTPQSLMMGSVTTLTIVALIADVGRDHVAVATSLSYVFRTTGQVLGVSLAGALTQAILQRELTARITGPNAREVGPSPHDTRKG